MAETQPAGVSPPARAWRIGRAPDPLEVRSPNYARLRDVSAGNRFDSISGLFDVLYFATELEGCFAETMRRFRAKPELADAVRDEWRQMGFMEPGSMPAEWRQKRLAARVSFPNDGVFLDVEAPESMEYLWDQLHPSLVAWGYRELDIAVVRGPDRRVTRAIAEWTAFQRDEFGEFIYDGVRYMSRLGEWECWAAFADVEVDVEDLCSITLGMPELQSIAKLYGITPH